MNQTTLQVNRPESEQVYSAARELVKLRSDLEALQEAHRDFGQLNRGTSAVNRLLQKLTRRSLRWYTIGQHHLQGAVFRLLRDIAGILEGYEIALRETSVAIADLRARQSAIEYRLHQMKLNGRIYETVKEIETADPIVGQAAWDVKLPDTVTTSDVFYCFRLLLNRIPDQSEWLTHYSRLGEDLSSVVTSFLNSPEFGDRHLLERATGQWQLVQLPEFKMYVSPEDNFVGGSIIREREYEPHLANIFRQYLRPGMHVLDIGANMGYFSMLAASLVGPTGHVTSWEPSPGNVKLLLANKLVNGFSQMEIVQAAAGSKSGLLNYFPNFSNGMVMQIGDVRPEDAAAAETVMALRIDDYISPGSHVGFIKIDVEGHEYEALRGALDLIQRDRPVMVSEFCPKALQNVSGTSGEEFLRHFAQLGYAFSILDGPQLRPATIEEVLSHHERCGVDHIDIVLRPVSQGL